MGRKRKSWRILLLCVATVILLAVLSQVLPALPKGAAQENPPPFPGQAQEKPPESGPNETGPNETDPNETGPPVSYEVSLDQLRYYTVEIAGQEEGEPAYFAGFSSGEKALEPWLAAAGAAGRQGKLVQQSFPQGRLSRWGETPGYLSEFMLLCNQQIRHLRRGADFFGNIWEAIQEQNTTWKRLDLLLEEGDDCRRQMAGLAAYYQEMDKLESFNSLSEAWDQWLARLGELKRDKDGRTFWLAQQQALTIVNLWRRLLWEAGFV
jgi:hypothetical protein